MLVYGDHCERVDPAQWLSAVAGQLQAVADLPPGIDRHARLASALIDAGRLLQGVADAGRPFDELSNFVHALAACVVASWDSHFADIVELPAAPRSQWSQRVELRLPEGFAFYAVYPEAYVEAARKLKLCGPPKVIGIRSIGATLGPIVAAALEAGPAVSVRPFGDAFARQVELPPEIIERDAHYVIVDEGPGLSGSSFGAVADWLEARGVPLERMAFLPSHAGDLGPQASGAHRRRWQVAQRVAAEFDPSVLKERFGPLEEFAGGGASQRRKFLGCVHGERVLLKFAGLGATGERKLAMARTLHAAALSPEPLGLVHGFLVERWCTDAQPLRPDEKPVAEIGRYIGARARLFPVQPGDGASVGELLTMCHRNIGLALGDEAVRNIPKTDAEDLNSRVARVRTDGKLDREEWLRLEEGRLLKTDALDHHQAHDLTGCQGVEWDIAGAIEEFGLNAEETARLIAATGISADADLLEFYRLAYAAFRLGQATLAGDQDGSSRYARSASLLLHQKSLSSRESQGFLV